MHSAKLPSLLLVAILSLLHQNEVVDSFVTNVSFQRECNFMCKLQIIDPQLHKRSFAPLQRRRGQYQQRICKSTKLNAQSTSIDEREALNLSEEEAQQSLDYLASLIQLHLKNNMSTFTNAADTDSAEIDYANPAYILAKSRFTDLTTALLGEILLENLFTLAPPSALTDSQLKYAIISLQSLLIHAMQTGVKGNEESQKKLVRHLYRRTDPPPPKLPEWSTEWTSEDVRRLKFYRNVELGKGVLASLKRKRTAVGAYELLIEMGVWTRVEEVTLLRSGFPVRFLESEIKCSLEAEKNTHDPDTILGIRQDLRHQKVYTIDSQSTLDIDDGISVEKVYDSNNEETLRYWIHIADVDRWAPRGSELLEVAQRRGTSLYLPGMTIGMFPENMASDVMSLSSNTDKHALSLSVQLNPDGSILSSSITLSPSLIRVDYRLTYEQVDEMLEEGVGYTEEWEIGALLAAATKRRRHRVEVGSTEGLIPFPIPKGFVTVTNDEGGEYKIDVRTETTHNSGSNRTIGGMENNVDHYDPYASPISSSQLIVTEMMILAGEAIGKWHTLQSKKKDQSSVDGHVRLQNELLLPFRRQPEPDYRTRVQESKQADFLFAMNKFYPHAWYCRRFFKSVQVSEEPGPHFGMGLDCYVQWSSPIRRFTDLQVHAAVKRHIRREKVNDMLSKNIAIPKEIRSLDLGCDIAELSKENNVMTIKEVDPINYKSGLGMIFAARPIQTSSGNFWLFEYIRQKVEKSNAEVVFESVVLGCVDHDRFQYAIYVYELGLEHRYLSENGKLDEGQHLWLKVVSVNPRLELLTFSLAPKSGGIHHAQ